jgi:hypothetical protein
VSIDDVESILFAANGGLFFGLNEDRTFLNQLCFISFPNHLEKINFNEVKQKIHTFHPYLIRAFEVDPSWNSYASDQTEGSP